MFHRRSDKQPTMHLHGDSRRESCLRLVDRFQSSLWT